MGILFITGFLIIMVVFLYFRFSFPGNRNIQLNKNIQNYLTYLSREIGDPPDLSQAGKLAEALSMVIIVNGTTINDKQPTYSRSVSKFRIFFKIKKHHKRHFKLGSVNQNTNIFTFFYKPVFRQIEGKKYLPVLLLLLAGILFSVYRATRRILQPIKKLERAMDAVAMGNLNTRVVVASKDELGQLASRFNSMTERIDSLMKNKQQLLLDISHELKTPLTRANVGLELISKRGNTKNIRDDLKEMDMMITELLESQRLDAGYENLNLIQVDFVMVIKEVVLKYKAARPPVRFSSQVSSLFIEIDKNRMQTVLTNLIENSLKYQTGDNRAIEITLVQSKGNESKNNILGIRDYGPGIPEDSLTHIFEPFFRVDKSRDRRTGGFGLGLSLCKKIVEAHGFTIAIQNNVNKGITTEIKF